MDHGRSSFNCKTMNTGFGAHSDRAFRMIFARAGGLFAL